MKWVYIVRHIYLISSTDCDIDVTRGFLMISVTIMTTNMMTMTNLDASDKNTYFLYLTDIFYHLLSSSKYETN